MRVVVGRIGRAQGLRGEVTVEVRTDSPEERFVRGAVLHLDPAPRGGPDEVRVAGHRWQAGRLVLSLVGVGDRAAAELLRGSLLEAEVDVTAHDGDEFHDMALVGLRVEDRSGRTVGSVADVLHLPGQDLLVVTREGASELLVPFAAALVPVVDIPGGRLVIELPEGLAELGGS